MEYKGEDKPLKGGEESQPMHCVPSNPPPNENPEGIKGGYKSTLYQYQSESSSRYMYNFQSGMGINMVISVEYYILQKLAKIRLKSR